MLTPGGSNVAEATAIGVGRIRATQKPVAVTCELIEFHRVMSTECVLMEHDQTGVHERLELFANTTLVGKRARLFGRAEREAGDQNIGGSGWSQLEKTENVFYLASANNSAESGWHLLAIRVACIPFQFHSHDQAEKLDQRR